MALRLVSKRKERRKIGEVLVQKGFIEQKDLDAVLAKASKTQLRLGELLVKDNAPGHL